MAWGGACAQRVAGPEVASTVNDLVASRPWVQVENVSRPTMTVYSPKGENTGAAMVVFPGGGYQILAIDLEGTEVCDWLTSRGITCVLLKYRVPGSGLIGTRDVILVRVQVETNYPGPARQAMQPTSVGGQTGQPLLQLLNHRS
jgi:hypothetical protein